MATFSATIIASSDDADQSVTTVSTTDTALNASSQTQWIGFRFQNVTIGQGDTIDAAELDVYFTNTSYDSPYVTIYGEDIDDAPTFTTGASDISNRTATTATVTWDADDVGAGVRTSPDISTIIQEIVDRPGWTSGNDLVIIVTGIDVTSIMRVRAYDAGGGDYATINIDYTPGGTTVLATPYIDATATLYAPTLTPGTMTLSVPYIDATATLYAPAVASSAYGPITIANVTNHEAEGVDTTSFHHETPAGDNRLLLVMASYKDTNGISLLTFGESGTGNGQLSRPLGIAIDSDGYIYITDTENDRVQKFASDGTFFSKWGSAGTGDGQFNAPAGIAISNDGYVFVVDRGNNRVQKFTADGTFVDKWGSYGTGDGQFFVPMYIAIDSAGDVYVTDNVNDRVQKFNADGTYVSQWGTEGTAAGEFYGPMGIAISSADIVYVMDSNGRIQTFDIDGVYISEFGGYGTGDGQFRGGSSLAVASSGNVFVADYYGQRVQKFTAGGEFLLKWGSEGAADGQFKLPADVAIDADGYVLVVDRFNHRVQKFSPTPNIVTAYYGITPMSVGPIVNGGDYFTAFYTLKDPPVGDAEVAMLAPSGPDAFLITAMSFAGAETTSTDYTAPDAGRAESETSTTALKVLHGRDYYTNTLSIWATLYETAGSTLTAAADNILYIQRNVGDLRQAVGLRHTPTATGDELEFGATASAPVTPYTVGVIHIDGLRGTLVMPYLDATATLYAPVSIVNDSADYLVMPYLDATATLYAPTVNKTIAMPYIDATATLYTPTVVASAPAAHFIELPFIGRGLPNMYNMPYIDAAVVLYEPSITIVLSGAYLDAEATLYAPTVAASAPTPLGGVYAPVSIQNVS